MSKPVAQQWMTTCTWWAESLRLQVAAVLCTVLLAVSLWSPVLGAQEVIVDDSVVSLSAIFVNRVNIFEPAQARQSRVYDLVNKLHRTTREQTILRELAVAPGSMITGQDAAEFERMLRRLDLFSSVSVELRPDSQSEQASPGAQKTAQLHIKTRDRVSIVAGASGSFLGGVGELGGTLGERNVAGLGDSLLLSYTGNTENEIRGAISYNDLHFFNSSQRALYQIGRTEEGDFYRLKIQKPYRRAQVTDAWSVLAESVQRDIDFYEQGFSVVQIPELRQVLEFGKTWRQDSTGGTLRRGFLVRYKDLEYQQSRGLRADTIDAPSNTTQYYAALTIAKDSGTAYRKANGVDTLKFTQDLAFGSSTQFQLGFIHSRQTASLNPRLTIGYTNAAAVSKGSLLRFSVSGSATFDDVVGGSGRRQDQPWSVSASVKWFNTHFKRYTFASRIDYTLARNEGGLPVQYTLGENNGLRGYPSRYLSGRERIRLNLEERLDPDWRVGLFDIGLVGFVDVGWVDDEADQLRRSVGMGLRLGSNVLFGAQVLRLDLAVPLDDAANEHEPTVSISMGQAFVY